MLTVLGVFVYTFRLCALAGVGGCVWGDYSGYYREEIFTTASLLITTSLRVDHIFMNATEKACRFVRASTMDEEANPFLPLLSSRRHDEQQLPRPCLPVMILLLNLI